MGRPAKIELLLDDNALEEVCLGMQYASLAITDNKRGTLANIGKVNPWQIEALRVITGSEEQAHKPLRTILAEDMDLILDWELDISGITKGGQFLDTQGYIAHNDECVVLSFRCTTSAFDWLTNFSTTSSAWELEEDLAQGHAGICSSLDGLCCNGGEYKPRVHTGFYNNLLAALPRIKRHIDPFLVSYERPRKLFVVGHSLGAGLATLAGCYFMTEYKWERLPQSLVIVTAGSPRACCRSMKEVIDKRRKELGSKVRMYRVVKGDDAVVSVPPKLFGFCHLIDPIKITDGGRIVVRTREDDPETDLVALTKFVEGEDLVENYDYDEDEDRKTKYDRQVSRIPKALRDHMPDFYLKPLFRARGIKHGSLRACVSQDSAMDKTEFEQTEDKKKPNRTWVPKMFRNNNKEKVSPTYF